jgi:predicted permease
MGAFADVLRRLRLLGRRKELEERLDDEIRFHVEQQIEKNRRAGMTPDEARRKALIRFGGVEQTRERTRDELRAAPIEHLVRDVRYGLRSLRRHRAFSAMAVLSLAIGIGANAAIFGIAHAVLFRQSPLADPATLVNAYETERGSSFNPMSYANIEDLRKGTTSVFSGIAASTFIAAGIERAGTVTTIMGEAVTGGAFGVLGIKPYLGRVIQPEDDVALGGHPVVMLSYGYWQRAFGGDPQVVGRALRMGRRNYTIIGVAPPDYRGGVVVVSPAFYVPMMMANELMGTDMLGQRSFHSFFVRARLRPGVTQVEAEHAASLVAASLNRTRPEGWIPGQGFGFVPTADVQVFPGLDPLLRASALLLIVVVALVLLLACTNLASFLLARALDRGQEVALRRALGATRGALARQLLVESALLGLGGAVAGFVLALVLLNVLVSSNLPLPYGLRLDLHLGLDWKALVAWRVLALTAGAGLLAGGVLGLVPAIQGTRADLASALKTGSRGSQSPGPLRWRNVLVAAQIAISLVLLVGAGLFLRSWQQSLSVDPGFGRAPTSVLSVMVPVITNEDNVQRTRRLLERFRTTPGVEAVGIVWPLPLELSSSQTDFTIDGRVPPPGKEAFRADRETVDSDFFNAAGMTIVDGRTFNDDDRQGSRPVAIISQGMARRFWPQGNPLGQILRRPDPAQDDVVIVGIVSDINIRSLGEAPRDVIYLPYTQGDGGAPIRTFIARTAEDPARTGQALITAGREVDPDLQVVQTTTMAEHLTIARLPSQIGALLLSAFAAMALALAAVGVYGMVRYTVATRTREVGIRIALGADAGGVARLLATHGVRLVVIGGAIGLVASLLAARVLAAMLFGLGSFEPLALIGAPLVLGVAAWLAAYLPARRATRVDPLAALRAD